VKKRGGIVSGKIILLGLMILATGCVSQDKFDDLSRKNQSQEARLKEMQNLLERNQKENVEQKAKLDEQAKIIGQLERKLGNEASDKQSLTASLAQMKKAIHELSENEEETKKRIKEYKDLLSRFRGLIDAGALSIKFVGGKMVVALSSDVLFSSGSADLSEDGKKAIRDVGTKLAAIPEKEFQIEGHTDDVPIHKGRFPSNWELASARAITVVNELVEVGLPKNRISAAAFADTKPVKPNDSAEARSANRRIEIVVVPDLSKLPGNEELNKMK
jgi:chemotaxis protein MotB